MPTEPTPSQQCTTPRTSCAGTAVPPWPTCRLPPHPRPAGRRRPDARRRPPRVRRVRRGHRARRPALPAGPRPLGRRPGRRRDLPGAVRGPLVARRPAAALRPRAPDARRRRHRACRSGCSSSATTPAGPTASSGRRPRPGCAPSSATTGSPPTAPAARPRCARCASSAARSPVAARSCCGRARPSSSSGPHLIGRRHRRRPRARRRGDRLHRGGDHRGRPGVRPRLPDRGPAGRRRRHRLPDPRPATRTRRSAERTAFANDARADLFISLHMEAHGSEHARGVASYYYGTGSGRLLHGRRAVRQPGPPRGRSPAPACSTSARTPRPGTCCG